MNLQKGSMILGNYYNKYDTKNPIERLIVTNYEKVFKKLVGSLKVKTAYEIGTGEGVLLKWIYEIRPDIKTFGSDIKPIFNPNLFVKGLNKPIFLINKAENLPFLSNSIDLIIACEVLEHLVNPSLCMQEFQRLNAKFYLLSVPNDHLWRILNLIRLKYIKDLGNTPGHVNHWSRKSFYKFISGYLNVQYSVYAQPWIFVFATGKRLI